jgi:hypothetical protein
MPNKIVSWNFVELRQTVPESLPLVTNRMRADGEVALRDAEKKKGRLVRTKSPLNVTTLGSGETRYGEEGSAWEEGINHRAVLPCS